MELGHHRYSLRGFDDPRQDSMRRHIGALPLNRIGALIGSRLERLARLPTSILFSVPLPPTLRLFRRPTNSPISAWTPNCIFNFRLGVAGGVSYAVFRIAGTARSAGFGSESCDFDVSSSSWRRILAD